MLGQSAFSRGSSATSDNRIFVYEVAGLQQNNITDRSDCQIRTSASTFVQVPYNRMNEKMQQILRMGGTIVSIHPLGETA
jgi:phycocyanin-associated, rod